MEDNIAFILRIPKLYSFNILVRTHVHILWKVLIFIANIIPERDSNVSLSGISGFFSVFHIRVFLNSYERKLFPESSKTGNEKLIYIIIFRKILQ